MYNYSKLLPKDTTKMKYKEPGSATLTSVGKCLVMLLGCLKPTVPFGVGHSELFGLQRGSVSSLAFFFFNSWYFKYQLSSQGSGQNLQVLAVLILQGNKVMIGVRK